MNLNLALALAEEAHAGQTRRGMPWCPYVNHPIRVGMAAMSAGLSHDAVIAGFLHDVVEDTDWTFGDLQQRGVPHRALELVKRLTKWWPDGTEPDIVLREKALYYVQIIMDREATVLKVIDRTDNLMDMVPIAAQERSWARSYLAKTTHEFDPVLAAAQQTHPHEVARFVVARGFLEQALLRLKTERVVADGRPTSAAG